MPRGVAAALLLFFVPIGSAEETKGKPDLDWRQNPLDVRSWVGYYVSPPDANAGARRGDERLARWAVEAWDNALDGLLCGHREPATRARLRIYWGMTPEGLGRMQTIDVGGERGGEVYVRLRGHEMEREIRSDPLMHAAFVYRTLLHEIGHVLGLPHSLSVDDAMYFGGDVAGYYRRYRERLETLEDIREFPGLSPEDLKRVRALYPPSYLWRLATPPPKPPQETE